VSGLGDSPAFTGDSASTNTLLLGLRYTAPQSLWLTDARWWAHETGVSDAAMYFRPVVVLDPLGTPVARELSSDWLQATATGWQTILPFAAEPVAVGTVYDLVLVVQDRTGGVPFSGDWDYLTPNNQAIPAPGEAIHANKTLDAFRISQYDDAAADRTADLDTLTAGDNVTWNGDTKTINSIVDLGLFYEIEFVDPTQAPPDGVTQFDFFHIGAHSTSYEKVANALSGVADADGWIDTDGSYSPGSVTLDDNAYGIDAEVQPAYVSPDWDVVAYS
jgi:hypothetical protein